jgi:IS1 family transposase
MVSMNRLSLEKRAQVVRALVEGASIRATVRMTGAAKNTVTKLLVELGQACSEYQDGVMQNLACKEIQVDEIWAFVGAKEKKVTAQKKAEAGWGDAWTFVSLDADTKLVPCFAVGNRTMSTAIEFMRDLQSRLANRVQLTTDGYHVYLRAVPIAFGGEIDYGMLVKIYGHDPKEPQRRYSPGTCIGAQRRVIQGEPDWGRISTSYIERQNLTMRMGMRRLTRLTNAFSKKAENLMAAVALHFMHYNFARPHKTLSKPYPTTPAMAAGLTDHVWTVEEIVALLDVTTPQVASN